MIRRFVRFVGALLVLAGLVLLAWGLLLWAAVTLPWMVNLALLAIGVGAAMGVLTEEKA